MIGTLSRGNYWMDCNKSRTLFSFRVYQYMIPVCLREPLLATFFFPQAIAYYTAYQENNAHFGYDLPIRVQFSFIYYWFSLTLQIW